MSLMPLRCYRFLQTGLIVCTFLFCCLSGSAETLRSSFNSNKITGDTVIKNCSKGEQIGKIITEAISIGGPVYNSGYHEACYRIYEWAGYKILYEYGKECKEVEKVLKTAIEKSHGDYSDLEKAWIMRAAFDKIMGVPTETGDPTKKPDTNRKG